MSKCYVYASNPALVLTASYQRPAADVGDSLLLKYDIIIICHFSHDCVKHPSGRTFGSATAAAPPRKDYVQLGASEKAKCDRRNSVRILS